MTTTLYSLVGGVFGNNIRLPSYRYFHYEMPLIHALDITQGRCQVKKKRLDNGPVSIFSSNVRSPRRPQALASEISTTQHEEVNFDFVFLRYGQKQVTGKKVLG